MTTSGTKRHLNQQERQAAEQVYRELSSVTDMITGTEFITMDDEQLDAMRDVFADPGNRILFLTMLKAIHNKALIAGNLPDTKHKKTMMGAAMLARALINMTEETSEDWT